VVSDVVSTRSWRACSPSVGVGSDDSPFFGAWTPGDVARAEELITQGLMHEAGVRAFERRQTL